MIYLMKIGPYDPTIPRLIKYESLKLLTKQLHDPGIQSSKMFDYLIRDVEILKQFDFVTTSNLKRAKESALFLKQQKYLKNNVKIYKTDLLNEVMFDISKLCSKKEYEKQGSAIVRERFKEFFINDKLMENCRKLEDRCVGIDKIVNRLEDSSKNILFISHTFFIFLYILRIKEPNIFNNRKLINKYLDPNKRIMQHCHLVRIK